LKSCSTSHFVIDPLPMHDEARILRAFSTFAKKKGENRTRQLQMHSHGCRAKGMANRSI
jgi:hypothetical protein